MGRRIGADYPRARGVERTAQVLVERLGKHAFDFALEQAELVGESGTLTSVEHWCAIARAIEGLIAPKPTGPLN